MAVAWMRSASRRGGGTGLAVFAAYAVVAFLYFGLRLIVEPGDHYFGYGSDPKAFIWCFGWWPTAILHGENPFVSHALWAPGGVNLLWTTSVPGLALLFAPLTLLTGPLVSYDVCCVLLPAAAAWTAYVLCRHLTRALWPSLVGGYLFGFSSYELGQEEGHPHMTAVFLVPLVALVLIRYVEGELGGRGLVVRLGPLLGAEFLFSTELTFTLGLATGAALVLAFVLLPARRRRIAALVPALAGACLLAALLTAPFVYYAVSGFRSNAFHPPESYVTDLVNFAVPTKLALASLGWAGGIARRFPGNDSEQDAYLGLPALIIVALFAWSRRRTGCGRLLVGGFLLAALVSLGARLKVGGASFERLPWALVEHSPLFDNVLPSRLALYATFAAALIVALWTAGRPAGALRVALPALAMLALVPNPAAGVWASSYAAPAFFTQSSFRSCLARGENILPLPVSEGAESMLWQALDGYRFTMAGGAIAPQPPASFLAPADVAFVTRGNGLSASQVGTLRAFIAAKHVTSVVVDASEQDLWAGALDRIATPDWIGGVVVYHLSDGSPSCPGAP